MWAKLLFILFCTTVHANISDRVAAVFNSLAANRCQNQTENAIFDQCNQQYENTLATILAYRNYTEAEFNSYKYSSLATFNYCLGNVQCDSLKKIKFIVQGMSYVFSRYSIAHKCIKQGNVFGRDTECSNKWLSSNENEDQFAVLYNHRADIFKCIDEPLRGIADCDETSRQIVADAVYTVIDILAAFSEEINKDRVFFFDQFKNSNITLSQ